MRRSFILSVGALVLCAVPVEAQDLFLTNARILDPRTETVRSGNLLILDGRIAGSDEPPPTFSGERLDLGARWVIPGLHDLHAHTFGNVAPGITLDAPGSLVIAQRLLY